VKGAKAFGPPSSPPSPGFSLQEGLWFGDFDDEQAAETAAASMAAMAGRVMGARPFPAAAQKLVQLTRSDDADINKVVRVLEMDPGLSQRVLRLVNSAGYGLRIRCTSLGHATALLGQVKLRQIATSAALFDHFGKPSPITRRKQEHASLVASLCRYLAIHLGLPQDDLFTIGLLHDLGQLMMLDDGQAEYTALVESHELPFDSLYLAERELLGFDHAILAGQVLASWNIPSPIPEVIALHHQPALAHQRGLDISAMVQTLRFADQMAHLLEHDQRRTGPHELAESEAASYLDFSEVQIAAMWRDLQGVHEATRNRRLNIFDVAPRSVNVPASLSPRDRGFSGPPSYASFVDSARPSRLEPTETIAVTSYEPAPFVSERPDLLNLNPPSAAPSPTSSVPSPASRRADGTLDLVPLDRMQQDSVPQISSFPIRESSQPASVRYDSPAPGGPSTERLVLSTSAAPRQFSDPPAHEQPSISAPIAPLYAPRIASVPERFVEESFFAESEQPNFYDRSIEPAALDEDPSPEIFPCALCYGPTFGASCHACGASVCSLHQTSDEWCVACEAEFRNHRAAHPMSELFVLSSAVAVGVASASSWFFFSLQSALGMLGLCCATGFGVYALRQTWLKVRFKRARRLARLHEMPQQRERMFRPSSEAPPASEPWADEAPAEKFASPESPRVHSTAPLAEDRHPVLPYSAPDPFTFGSSSYVPTFSKEEEPPRQDRVFASERPNSEPGTQTIRALVAPEATPGWAGPITDAPVHDAPGHDAPGHDAPGADAPTALPPPPSVSWMEHAQASLAPSEFPGPDPVGSSTQEPRRLSFAAPVCSPGEYDAVIIVPPAAPQPPIHCTPLPAGAVSISDASPH